MYTITIRVETYSGVYHDTIKVIAKNESSAKALAEDRIRSRHSSKELLSLEIISLCK